VRCFFWIGWASRAGGRREGAKEKAVVHSGSATAAAHSAVVAPVHDTPSPSSSSQVSEYTPHVDAMRMYGWIGQQPSSGFSDLAPSILHYNWF
jgi:hypothetical protein